MIIDVRKFVAEETRFWRELETILDRLDDRGSLKMPLSEAQRFHYLYERASADLAKVNTFAAEPETLKYLEALVGRAYSAMHASGERTGRFHFLRWLLIELPRTFRRHWRAFALSCLITVVGGVFGASALLIDPEAKAALMPFSHLLIDPSERVAMEESQAVRDPNVGAAHATFSTSLMTHNIRVSLLVMALGMTWGIGSVILLFYNGVILGAVLADYIRAGESVFLAGWLLPHGVVEIPAILIAGQAGLMLASALIGKGKSEPLGRRFREARRDLFTLMSGVALMLVWAGVVEAFLSQRHEPEIPYVMKITGGIIELAFVVLFFGFSGRGVEEEK